MKKGILLFLFSLISFLLIIHVMGQKKNQKECFAATHYALKDDTLDFDFYPRYPEDNIKIEWRKCSENKNNPCWNKFNYVKIFKIKNNFSHDIYLDVIRTGAGYCIPECFTYGLIKPDSIEYTAIYFDLDAKPSVLRNVSFHFTFCPNTPEAESYIVNYVFEGKQK